jgi:hypothetical protein
MLPVCPTGSLLAYLFERTGFTKQYSRDAGTPGVSPGFEGVWIIRGEKPTAENHRWVVAPHFMRCNFCPVHQTLRVTPAMEVGTADHLRLLEEVIALQVAQNSGAPSQDFFQRPAYFYSAVVVNESPLPESVHEQIDPRARGADHLRQNLVT